MCVKCVCALMRDEQVMTLRALDRQQRRPLSPPEQSSRGGCNQSAAVASSGVITVCDYDTTLRPPVCAAVRQTAAAEGEAAGEKDKKCCLTLKSH